MKGKTILSVFLSVVAFPGIAFATCDIESVEASATVHVTVGTTEAAFNGGYVAAAYEDLGEELDNRPHLGER